MSRRQKWDVPASAAPLPAAGAATRAPINPILAAANAAYATHAPPTPAAQLGGVASATTATAAAPAVGHHLTPQQQQQQQQQQFPPASGQAQALDADAVKRIQANAAAVAQRLTATFQQVTVTVWAVLPSWDTTAAHTLLPICD